MSTIHFDVTELGAIVAACIPCHAEGARISATAYAYADALGKVSTANAAAFNANYPTDHADAVDALDIAREAVALHGAGLEPMDLLEALRSAASLHYNCAYNSDFLLTVEGAAGGYGEVSAALMREVAAR